MKRRQFLTNGTLATFGMGGLLTGLSSCTDLLSEEAAMTYSGDLAADSPYKISLAQWSLRRSFWSGQMDNLDFAKVASENFGINGLEYVNQFFFSKATDMDYLKQMKQRADEHNCQSLIIMIDMEGSLGSLDEAKRLQAVDNHYKWIDAAKFLGCHSIRVNAAGKGDREAVAAAATDSLGRLSEYSSKDEVAVIVENHGGYSGDAQWLSSVIQQVNSPFCGVLPDFGNFYMNLFPPKFYDKYQGIKELMPYAKGVSAKSFEFTSQGEDKRTDFKQAMQIVKDSGYTGYIGIEYEGYKLSEEAGIKATKELIVKYL